MPQSSPYRSFTLVSIALCTAILAASCGWYLYSEKAESLSLATIEAKASYNKDLVYRRWAAQQGGVYVPITAKTPPSPYLTQIPEQNIATPSGRTLTLINPAYMTRQVHELAKEQYGVQGHITSLTPLRPENAPDPWEAKALQGFVDKESELASLETINGQRYLRYMHAMVTEESCLKCHASQGYRLGDIRGGISVSVPMASYEAAYRKNVRPAVAIHLLLWLLGVTAIVMTSRRLSRQYGLIEDKSEELKLRVKQSECLYQVAKLLEGNHQTLEERLHKVLTAIPSGWRESSATAAQIVYREQVYQSPNFVAGQWQQQVELTVRSQPVGNLTVVYLAPWEEREGGPFLPAEQNLLEAIANHLHSFFEQLASEEERGKIAAQLRQAQKMEAIGTLAGGIAHDFNNILTPILGYADLIQDHLGTAHPLQDHIQEVIKASHRAKDLVKQILTFSRQSGQALGEIALQPIIKEALKLLRSSLPTSIAIKQDIAADCGYVLADPTQIHQVIMNLCTNAYFAMRESGGTLAVSVQPFTLRPEEYPRTLELPPGEYLRLEVSDTGVGMDRETLERIFEPYFTTKKIGEGTGLGLSVVHGIINSLGGVIKVYSEPGQGTTFHLYFPLLPRLAAPETPPVDTPIPGGTEKILVVDDEKTIVELETTLLEQMGYTVTGTTSSREALALFTANPDQFDLVITDMTMPELSGADLTRQLLALRPVPIILCTGFSELLTDELTKNLGIRHYLMKPIFNRDLARIVRTVLDAK